MLPNPMADDTNHGNPATRLALGLKARARSRTSMIRALMATSLSSPDLIQLTAASGFDCVIFDCEHFAIAEVELSTLCELALLRGLTPVVRTLATREMIGKVLRRNDAMVLLEQFAFRSHTILGGIPRRTLRS